MTAVRVLLALWLVGSVGLICGWWRAARAPQPRVLRVSLDEYAAQALAVVAEPPARFRCLTCSPPVAVNDPATHSRMRHGARPVGPEDDPKVMAVIAERARGIGKVADDE